MNIKFDFSGKTVIVTGSAGGIGKAIASSFSESGAKVIIADYNEKLGKETAKEISAKTGNHAEFIYVDVTKQSSADALVNEVMDRHKDIDILVNNAGVSGKISGNPLTGTEDSDFDSTYNVNVKGLYHMCKSIYDIFKNKKSGKIVNMASVAGHSTNLALVHYSVSKAAAITFTRNLALELGPSLVNVNCVCPGYVYTDIYKNAADQFRAKVPAYKDLSGLEICESIAKTNCAMKRLQTGEDIAKAVMFLSSDEAGNITGEILDVAGGFKLY